MFIHYTRAAVRKSSRSRGKSITVGKKGSALVFRSSGSGSAHPVNVGDLSPESGRIRVYSRFWLYFTADKE